MNDAALTVISQGDLTLLTEGGLITPAAAQQIAVAAASLPAMHATSTPAAERHFGRTGAMISVREDSPVDQARDVLSALDRTWSNAASDFHRLREMAFDIKLRQAKLNVQRKRLDAVKDPDEALVAEAEIQLEQARIDGLQAKFSAEQQALQGVIARAAEHSERYARICQQAGVAAFTEEDFLREEVSYLVKTAFWHAALTFRLVDMRSKDMIKGGVRARDAMAVKSPPEVVTYFEALGISKSELSSELGYLEGQQHAFANFHAGFPGGGPSFFDERFGAWLANMVAKFGPAVTQRLRDGGPDRLKRVQQIINPDAADRGKSGEKEMDRGTLFV